MLSFELFDLPLRHPFRIARETTDVQRTMIVRVDAGAGSGGSEVSGPAVSGLGEAVVCPYYHATEEALRSGFTRLASAVAGETLRGEEGEPERLWGRAAAVLDGHPGGSVLLSAFDCAVWDAWGQLHQAPLCQLWGLAPDVGPPSCYTLGMATPEEMAVKLREEPTWPIYKIKMGGAKDLEALRLLRTLTPARLQVDANCAWTLEEALAKLPVLSALGVEMLEQPLPPEELGAMEALRAASEIPLFADESCQRLEDLESLVGRFDGVNIKLIKCGGLTPARRLVQRARELGLQVMIGCMTESSIGISAAAQLWPLLDRVDLDGAVLLARDLAEGVIVSPRGVQLSQRPGLGLRTL